MIRSKSLDVQLEENYSEALRFCHYAIRDPALRVSSLLQCQTSHLSLAFVQVDPDVKALLEHDKAKHISSSSSPFWIVVNAINRFIQTEGKGFLPVSGSIPDMTTDTESYVSLKNMYAFLLQSHCFDTVVYYSYAAQEQLDVKIVKLHVKTLVEESAVPSSAVPSAEYIEGVVKNVRFLQCASTHSLASEYRKEQHVIDALRKSFHCLSARCCSSVGGRQRSV